MTFVSHVVVVVVVDQVLYRSFGHLVQLVNRSSPITNDRMNCWLTSYRWCWVGWMRGQPETHRRLRVEWSTRFQWSFGDCVFRCRWSRTKPIKDMIFSLENIPRQALQHYCFSFIFRFLLEKLVLNQGNVSPTPFLVRRQGRTRTPRTPHTPRALRRCSSIWKVWKIYRAAGKQMKMRNFWLDENSN